jgi:hypothetical protein
MHPALKDDAFLQGRIRWAARRHGLPSSHAFFVSHQRDSAASLLERIPKDSRISEPVLIFATAGPDWSVDSSRGLGGEIEGRWHEIPFVESDDLRGFPEDNEFPATHKRQLDTLRVKASGRSLQFRSSPGGRFLRTRQRLPSARAGIEECRMTRRLQRTVKRYRMLRQRAAAGRHVIRTRRQLVCSESHSESRFLALFGNDCRRRPTNNR